MTPPEPAPGAEAVSVSREDPTYPVHHRRPFPLEQLMELAHRTLNAYNRIVARWSIDGNHELFDTARFPWIQRVEAEWGAIRAELDGVLARPEEIPLFSDISPDQIHLTPYGKWKTFFFIAYGVRVDENCRRCPETTRVLGLIPGLQTAFFSILAPGVHIQPHRGPYGGVLRYHLALKVPEPRASCRIRVGDHIASWEEGKSLVFDDTYEHEAWNETSGQRVVLFVDFERPLRPALRAINRSLIRIISASPFVQDGVRRYEEWKRRQ
jgi:aspartyl/asparaginyl beta-hydroxylase (cupin superfamily)